MPKNRKSLGSNLAKVDATTDEEIARHMAEDDAPELTDEQIAEAELFEGDRFRAGGPGWQTRLNDALRAASAPRPAKRRAGRSLSQSDAERRRFAARRSG